MFSTEAKGAFIPGLTKSSKTPPSLGGFVDPSQQQDEVLKRLYYGSSASKTGDIAMEQAAVKASGLKQPPMRDASVNVSPSKSFSEVKAEKASAAPKAPATTPGGLPPSVVTGGGGATQPATPGFESPEGFSQYSFNVDMGSDLGMGSFNGPINIPGISYNADTKQWFNGYSGKTFDVDGTEIEVEGEVPFDPNQEVAVAQEEGSDIKPLDGFITTPSTTDNSPSPQNVSLHPMQVQGMATMLGDPIMQKLVANMSVSDFMQMVQGGFQQKQ